MEFWAFSKPIAFELPALIVPELFIVKPDWPVAETASDPFAAGVDTVEPEWTVKVELSWLSIPTTLEPLLFDNVAEFVIVKDVPSAKNIFGSSSSVFTILAPVISSE